MVAEYPDPDPVMEAGSREEVAAEWGEQDHSVLSESVQALRRGALEAPSFTYGSNGPIRRGVPVRREAA